MRRLLSYIPRDPIARNSFILFFSEGLSSFLMIVTGFLIARLLNVAEFGKFTSALAFAAIVGVVVDSGMGMVAAKDIAKGTSTDRRQLDQIFSWRLWVVVIACAATPLACWALLPPGDVRRLACWLTPGVLLVGMTDFFCWIFKGAQKALWCAGLQLASRGVLLILSALALKSSHPLESIVAAYAVAGAGMTAVGIGVIRRSMHALRWVRLPQAFFKQTLPDIYKMGAILVLSVMFTRVDLMIVARCLGDTSAGLFAAAGRIVDAIRLIPMVIYSVYLPVFSSFHNQPEQLRRRFIAAQDNLLLISVTIALLGFAFAWPLFTFILGPQYQGSVACFRVLVWTCVLMFSNILMFCLLYSLNDHRTPIAAIIGALTLEVALDLLFVPRFGIMAAAWARLAAELLNYIALAWGLVKTGVLSPAVFFTRPALLIATAAVLLWVLHRQPLVFQVALAWAGFMGVALASRLVRPGAEALS